MHTVEIPHDTMKLRHRHNGSSLQVSASNGSDTKASPAVERNSRHTPSNKEICRLAAMFPRVNSEAGGESCTVPDNTDYAIETQVPWQHLTTLLLSVWVFPPDSFVTSCRKIFIISFNELRPALTRQISNLKPHWTRRDAQMQMEPSVANGSVRTGHKYITSRELPGKKHAHIECELGLNLEGPDPDKAVLLNPKCRNGFLSGHSFLPLI